MDVVEERNHKPADVVIWIENCMRIIHAHKYYYMRAGAERFMLDMMEMQELHGHMVIPFSMHYPKNLPSPWSDYFVSEVNTEAGVGRGLAALRQAGRALWSREAYRNMCRLIDDVRPDLVHVHNIYTHLSPSILAACKRHNVPVVMSVHDYGLVSANYSLWDAQRNEPMNLDRLGLLATAQTRFMKDSYLATFVLEAINRWHHVWGAYDRRIDHYHVVSHFLADVMQRTGFHPTNMTMRYPFTQPVKAFRRSDEGYVLYVGRLERTKGVQTLVEAMQAFPDVELRIAGTGSYESELRQFIGKNQKVSFLGFVAGQALDDLRAGARVVVAPSVWHEVLGLVAVEAMSQGVPVIVSDRGGLREIVEDGVSGSVFKAGDVEDLQRVLGPYVHDQAFAHSLGEAAYERARALVDPERLYADIMGMYESVIRSRP